MQINGIKISIAGMDEFQFQQDAVAHSFNNCLLDGGCLIAHDTGLGKTNIAVHLAMYLTHHITHTTGAQPKVLVFTKPAHKIAWVAAVKAAKLDAKVASYNDKNLEGFQIVIIDEAHNLRNASNNSYQNVFKTIRSNKVNGSFPYVALLSATPYHNNIKELKNMLALIPFKADSAPYITLPQLFARAEPLQKELDYLVDFSGEENVVDVFKIAKKRHELDLVINELVQAISLFSIRETRKGIEMKYPDDVVVLGRFPNVHYENVETNFGLDVHNLIHKTIETISNKLKFAYQSKANYAPSFKSKSVAMSAIAKVNLLKRLDSSVAAFKESLDNMIGKIQTEIQTPQTVIKTDKQEHKLNVSEYLADLNFDLGHLLQVRNAWSKVSDQQKMEQLLDVVRQTTPANGKRKKIVIFSEFYATLDAIEQTLIDNGFGDRLIRYDANSDEKLLDTIDKNFNANNFIEDDFDILICTDKLAEGVNLHQASYLIHFDQKWNPQRLVQREGRINRLCKNGIMQPNIFVFTFVVNSVVEAIIGLQETIGDKLAMAAKFLNYSKEIPISKECIIPNFKYQYQPNQYLFYEWLDGTCHYTTAKREHTYDLIAYSTTRGWLYRPKKVSPNERLFLGMDKLPKNFQGYKNIPFERKNALNDLEMGQARFALSELYYNRICETAFDCLMNKYKKDNGFVSNPESGEELRNNNIVKSLALKDVEQYVLYEQPYALHIRFGNNERHFNLGNVAGDSENINHVLDELMKGNTSILKNKPQTNGVELPQCLKDNSLSWQDQAQDLFLDVERYIAENYQSEIYNVSSGGDSLVICYSFGDSFDGEMTCVKIHRIKNDMNWYSFIVEQDGRKTHAIEIEHVPSWVGRLLYGSFAKYDKNPRNPKNPLKPF